MILTDKIIEIFCIGYHFWK